MNARILTLGAVALATMLSVSAASGDAQAQTRVRIGSPQYHSVESGDTLYDLAGRYLTDVYNWPQLWGYNPHITNPHWIYPGDIVYLQPPTKAGEQPIISTPRQSKASELYLSVGGFIENEQISYVGRIQASPKRARMFSELDSVWVGFGDNSYSAKEKEEIEPEKRLKFSEPKEQIKVGSRFAIVRQVGSIEDPNDKEKVLGYKYVVLGSLRITEIAREPYLHTAQIDQSWQEIERGDLLVPYERQVKVFTPVQGDEDRVAYVLDTLQPRSNLGEFHYVYINKGSEAGVRPGHRFFAYQRREGTQRTNEKAGEKIPYTRVGQVLVIDVRKNYSTAVITDSSREIFRGDRLEMYKGY